MNAAPDSSDDSVIWFEEGIIGVPRARRFQLLQQPGSPLRLLRCLDIQGFNLPVVDPCLCVPDYGPKLGQRLVHALQLETDDPVLLLAITTVEPSGPVANLRAPVVINVRRRVAAQTILDDPSYPLRAPLAEVAAAAR